MKASIKRKKSERGVALIIAIFTMMLISVVATALILTAGTASAIKVNYKNSMQAFYDAKAGLEEGRSRLWNLNPNALNTAASNNCTPANLASNPMLTGQVCYITNPNAAAGETAIDPKNPSDPYYDTEYDIEFGTGALAAANPIEVPSNSPLTTPNIPGPQYKWVRITPRTQQSAGESLTGQSGSTDTSLLYFNGTGLLSWNSVGTPANDSQVLEITALAVTPGGGFSGRRLLQYTVAQALLGQALTTNASMPPTPTLNQMLPAALTLNGNGVTYSGSAPVSGNDGGGSGGVPAIAYTNSADTPPSCSTCSAPTGIPAVESMNLPSLMETPQGLDGLVNAITQDATVVINPSAGMIPDQTSIPSTMSATNPMIVVVNGDFHLTHASGSPAFTGYGLLLVTGTFYYDPDDSWNGIILVIGKGVFTNNNQNGNKGKINGAVLVANTRDKTTGALLSTLGPASYTQTGNGNGIQYNSSSLGQAPTLMPYRVLSFREIQLRQ